MAKRIIFAEDDVGIQDVAKIIVEDAGYELIIYGSGMPLLNNDFPLPDLFILDKQLSSVDGLDICRSLKNRPETKDIPVIMLSASPTIVSMAKAAGADDALEKPFKIRTLRELIAKYIG